MSSPLESLRNLYARIRNSFKVRKLRRPGNSSNNYLAIVSLLLILTFAVGDYVGQSRIRTPVDEAISKVLNKGDKPVDKKILQRAAIEAVLKASGDQWANYFPKSSVKTFQQTLQGRYSGIGIWLRKNSSGVLEVSSVQKDSPAAAAGIKVLDSLLEVNGNSMDGVTIPTAVAQLRGSSNEPVQLLLERNQNPFKVSVERAAVLTGDVTANQIAPGVTYIQVSAFTSHVSSDVKLALVKYKHSKGIILDLRDNPGGLIAEAVDLASLFLGEGTVVSYSRKGGSDVVLASHNSSADASPMTVLINRSTASSAEVVTGALQDRNRAVILGEKSYGKGTVQEISNLSDGSQLEITIGKYRTPSGRIIDQIGITPDLLVSDNDAIAKSVQVLGGLASIEDKGQVKK
jgi:carboxyl-terminal processing protease